MQNPSLKLRNKLKRDLALNLSELAIASGWDRSSLAQMDLPLECGKISYGDFRRVLNFRQLAHEQHRSKIPIPAAVARALPQFHEGPKSRIGQMVAEMMLPKKAKLQEVVA